MFFPLYIDNVYIGYWLIESSEIHAFDNIDTAIIEVIRDNIVTILKTVQYQNTVENTVRTDLFTGLNSAEYLFVGYFRKDSNSINIQTVEIVYLSTSFFPNPYKYSAEFSPVNKSVLTVFSTVF